jgi:hypothetical protein
MLLGDAELGQVQIDDWDEEVKEEEVCNTHFLRMIKLCQSNSALGCILKINSVG